jgi:pimeloyl-ACP methyl ester carboxylesterase
LVLVHGYGSSGALLFKIHKPLSERFKVYLIDTIGMSSSSRPKDFDRKSFDAETSISYFVEYLEKWRIAMNLTDFYLAGHSWGGYMVGNYAVKYP